MGNNSLTQLRNVTACRVKDLGLIEYRSAYEKQKECVHQLLEGGPQTILICEHPVILTLGRLAKESNILIPRDQLENNGVEIAHIDRGGDITLHSPGQLVVYPIFHLGNFGKDLHSYMRKLEQVAIDLLNDFDIVANRNAGQTGIWVGDKKIASIGIGVQKWISYHGLAINVSTDLKLFSMIKPCGLDVVMTSISAVKGKTVDFKEIKKKLVVYFSKNFNLNII